MGSPTNTRTWNCVQAVHLPSRANNYIDIALTCLYFPLVRFSLALCADYDNYIDIILDASSPRAARALKQVRRVNLCCSQWQQAASSSRQQAGCPLVCMDPRRRLAAAALSGTTRALQQGPVPITFRFT